MRVLQQCDRSGDGLLSLDEFGKLVRQLADGAAPGSGRGGGGGGGGSSGIGGWFGFGSSSKWTDADVRRAFQKYDANSPGRLRLSSLGLDERGQQRVVRKQNQRCLSGASARARRPASCLSLRLLS